MFATYLRDRGNDVIWLGEDDGSFDRIIESDDQIEVDFDKLPIPDRIWTNSMNPRYTSYGNYRYRPGTHYLSSNLCWWAGKKGCTFCVDSKKIIDGEPRKIRPVNHVISEIEDCVRIGHRECFDDAGTIPIGDWLENFCHAMIKSGLNKRVHLGCNLKPIKLDFKLMKEAGFGFVLVGLESANQKTLDFIQKGQHQANVLKNLKSMNDAGLKIHATSMFGYENESHEEEMNTVRFIQGLLKSGIAKTAQASVYSPPRTAPDPNSKGHKYIPMVYDAYKSPRFWYHKIKDIKHFEDFTYLLRGARLVVEEKIRKK